MLLTCCNFFRFQIQHGSYPNQTHSGIKPLSVYMARLDLGNSSFNGESSTSKNVNKNRNEKHYKKKTYFYIISLMRMENNSFILGLVILQYFAPALKLFYYIGVAFDFKDSIAFPAMNPFVFSKAQLFSTLIISQINL